MGHFNLRDIRKNFTGELIDTPHTRGAEIELAWIGFGESDKIRKCFKRRIVADCNK